MDTVPTFCSISELRASFGRASHPFVIDVRRAEAVEQSPRLIAGATWRDPFTVTDWQKYLPRHREVVVYCVHGFEISKNVSAALVASGIAARTLEGGLADWQAANLPTIQRDRECQIPSAPNTPSRWVTRARPKIDRIACPWLIRRFIDPLAEFLYVPSDQVRAVAEKTGAIPYDVPSVRFTHRDDRCSFDALIGDFAINDAALHSLATIVRGADCDQLELRPESAGLLAISLGLSNLFEDDHQMLQHGMLVYDALYARLQHAPVEPHTAALFAQGGRASA
jgi:rhodanese-related sulfurtransferase